MNEIKVWEKVYHENIVKIFELFDSEKENNMYLMMELAQYG
jgi:serine/threonine protein kinase